MKPGHLLIVGAGLAGLTAALALRRAGWQVSVHEQARALGEAGAGLTLSPGAGAGLAGLGLGPAILAASLPVPDIAFLHYQTGALLAGTRHAAAPADAGFTTARHIHRADLHAILLDAVRAAGAAIFTGRRLTAIEDGAGGVTARFENGESAAGDALIAADGVRSAARRLLLNDDSPPAFAGQIALRCLVPAAAAAPFMAAGRAAVFTGAGRVFNRYAIRGGATINVIGIAACDDWVAEGWSTPASVAEFSALFGDFHADVRGLIAAAPADSLIKWGLFTRQTPTQWHRGRTLLIGDAAHAMLPFLGLGAALAIEDALVLAPTLTAHGDFETSFEAFTHARAGRVAQVRADSERQGQLLQAETPTLVKAPSSAAALFAHDPLA